MITILTELAVTGALHGDCREGSGWAVQAERLEKRTGLGAHRKLWDHTCMEVQASDSEYLEESPGRSHPVGTETQGMRSGVSPRVCLGNSHVGLGSQGMGSCVDSQQLSPGVRHAILPCVTDPSGPTVRLRLRAKWT